MLKYENVSCCSNTRQFVLCVLDSGGAYRVTRTYDAFLPDIKYFYKNDYHRTDGPAVFDLEDERVYFWVNGMVYCSTKSYCEAAGMSGEETLMWVLRFGDLLPESIEGYYGEDWGKIPMDQL